MQKIRYGLIALSMLLCLASSAAAQVSIGINVSLFPELVPVQGYPVYYAPQLNANYFFYDGMYWVYQDDYWYASSWYNGPWSLVDPEFVPPFILRVPVYYYRQPPVYFHGWHSHEPPRWGQHWGHRWEQRRRGWDRWDRRSAPAPAPLPVYQRQYSGDRYPRQVEEQQKLHSQHYRYQPKDKIIRQHFKQQAGQKPPAPAQRGKKEEPTMKSPRQQEIQRSTPLQKGAPAGTRSQPQQRGGENVQKPAPVQSKPQQRAPAIKEQRQQPGAEQRQQQSPKSQDKGQRSQPQQRAPVIKEQRQQPAAAQHGQQAPRPQEQGQKSQDKGKSQEPKGGQGQGQQKDEERGHGRNK
jgi:hypothetical protein